MPTTLLPDPQLLALERAIGAQYEIIRLLGRGGMGAVYLARERALERSVAIKVLPQELASDDASRERFKREARTAANLTHPGIVPLHSFGESEGMTWFVMGYVRGQSLGARMAREGPLPPDDVRRILAELADALDYANGKGVVHRDIKPDNVLLDDETGRAMLTDFGIAKAAAHGATLTEVGAVVGSPHYMSPEQASGERDIDGRSDLYSLGVMGFAMLAGRLPFEGSSVRDVVVQHVTQPPPPLQALVANAPRDLVSTIMRCLAKERAARWMDAHALATALQFDIRDADFEHNTPAAQMRHAVPVIGSLLLADAAYAVAGFLNPALVPENLTWFEIPLGVAGTFIALTAAVAISLRRMGASWPDMLRHALKPPRSWALWYPDRWRTPEDLDVQRRLPAELRALRRRMHVAYGFIGACVAVGAVGLMLNGRVHFPHSAGVFIWSAVSLDFIGMGVLVSTTLAARKWGAERGLTNVETQKLAFGPTADPSRWLKPRYAAFLMARDRAPSLNAAPEPHDPAAFLREIVSCAKQLASPFSTLGNDAVAAARLAVASIEGIDAEITTLAADADPRDLAALNDRIAALGDPANESPSRRELRDMLVKQRELLVRLREQLDDAVAHRGQLNELLRTLWLQLATLRAEQAQDGVAAQEITARIRAIVREVAANVEVARG